MSQEQKTAIDPVCGMTVDIELARASGLTADFGGIPYYFCGRGCKLDFGDEPERYVDQGHHLPK